MDFWEKSNNQPVATKYPPHYAKKAGTKIFPVNPYFEPGLESYWVPLVFERALFGTRIVDDFFQIHTGGDIPFFYGVLKHLIENGWVDHGFIQARTAGWNKLEPKIQSLYWDALERCSGLTRADMYRFAEGFGKARHAVVTWSMGLTAGGARRMGNPGTGCQEIRPSEGPTAFSWHDTQDIREEVDRVCPTYRVIAKLRKVTTSRTAAGACSLTSSRRRMARVILTTIDLPEESVPRQCFRLSTRRGKQFNRMLLGENNPITGAHRNDIFMSKEDAEQLSLRNGDAITRNALGSFAGRAKIDRIKPGCRLTGRNRTRSFLPVDSIRVVCPTTTPTRTSSPRIVHKVLVHEFQLRPHHQNRCDSQDRRSWVDVNGVCLGGGAESACPN